MGPKLHRTKGLYQIQRYAIVNQLKVNLGDESLQRLINNNIINKEYLICTGTSGKDGTQ